MEPETGKKEVFFFVEGAIGCRRMRPVRPRLAVQNVIFFRISQGVIIVLLETRKLSGVVAQHLSEQPGPPLIKLDALVRNHEEYH